MVRRWARGPGKSCGNRRADGEELHPSKEYPKNEIDHRDFFVNVRRTRQAHLLNPDRRSMFAVIPGLVSATEEQS